MRSTACGIEVLNTSYFPYIIKGRRSLASIYPMGMNGGMGYVTPFAAVNTIQGTSVVGYSIEHESPLYSNPYTLVWTVSEDKVDILYLYRAVALLGFFHEIREMNGFLIDQFLEAILDQHDRSLLLEWIPEDSIDTLQSLLPGTEEMETALGSLLYHNVPVDLVGLETALATSNIVPSETLQSFGVRSGEELAILNEKIRQQRLLFQAQAAPIVVAWLKKQRFAANVLEPITRALDGQFELYGFENYALSVAVAILEGTFAALRTESDTDSYSGRWWKREKRINKAFGRMIKQIACFMKKHYCYPNRPSRKVFEAALIKAASEWFEIEYFK